MRKSRENGLFLDIPDEQWNDWHWQVENRIETLDELKKYVNLTKEEEEGVVSVRSRYLGDEGQKPLSEFIAAICEEIRTKAIRQEIPQE